MEALIENLTTNEAAIASGVTVAKINRMIEPRYDGCSNRRHYLRDGGAAQQSQPLAYCDRKAQPSAL